MPTHAERFANTLMITNKDPDLRELMIQEFRGKVRFFMTSDQGSITLFEDQSSATEFGLEITVCEDLSEFITLMEEVSEIRPDQFEQLIASAEEQMAMIRALGD